MKLLLDENLSRRRIPLLLSTYPDSSQVVLLKLESASDREIWEYAKANDYIIVTRDSDFHELGILYGAPPKVIWLKTGNQSKAATLRILIEHKEQLHTAFFIDLKNCIEIYS
jgi:predicted nuclease of predicted toxin-antitoxin system